MEFVVVSTKSICNIEIIKWAFEKGYRLASADMKDGIHINFSETEKFFLLELNEFYAQQNNDVSTALQGNKQIHLR